MSPVSYGQTNKSTPPLLSWTAGKQACMQVRGNRFVVDVFVFYQTGGWDEGAIVGVIDRSQPVWTFQEADAGGNLIHGAFNPVSGELNLRVVDRSRSMTTRAPAAYDDPFRLKKGACRGEMLTDVKLMWEVERYRYWDEATEKRCGVIHADHEHGCDQVIYREDKKHKAK